MTNSGSGKTPDELAQFINERIHNYARDALGRFALVFSAGSVVVNFMFTGAVRMFLVCPIRRFCYDTFGLPGWATLLIRTLVLFCLVLAVVGYIVSFWYAFAFFKRLHRDPMDTPIEGANKDQSDQKPNKTQGKLNRLICRIWQKQIHDRLDKIWDKVIEPILRIRHPWNPDLNKIWDELSSELKLEDRRKTAKTTEDLSFNILLILQIASYINGDDFAKGFAGLFPEGTCKVDPKGGADQNRVVINISRDTHRIARRTVLLDCWYFPESMYWLIFSFVMTSIVIIVFCGMSCWSAL